MSVASPVARSTYAPDRSFGTLGILWAIYGILRIVAAVFIFIEFPVLTLMFGALLNRVPNPYPWMTWFHFMLSAGIVILILGAIFAFLAAWALLGRTASVRTLACIAAFFGLIDGPAGIALGAFTLVLVLRTPRP
jgi:hypothetical protein